MTTETEPRQGIPQLATAIMLLGMAAACAVLFLVTIRALEPDAVLLDRIAGWLGNLSDEQRLALAALTAGLAILFLLPISRLFRSSGESSDQPALHLVDAAGEGFVLVDSQAVARIASAAITRIKGVIAAEVSVRPKGASAVLLNVEVALLPGSDVKRVGTNVREAASEAVTSLASLRVTGVQVRAHILDPGELHRVMR